MWTFNLGSIRKVILNLCGNGGTMKQVNWNKNLTELFIDMAMLNDEEQYILTSRIKGTTVTQQAMHLHKSEATIHRTIKNMKIKYDNLQKELPDLFPIRKQSKAEKYMDTH